MKKNRINKINQNWNFPPKTVWTLEDLNVYICPSDDEDSSSLDKDRDSIYEDLSEYSSGRGSLEMEKQVEDANKAGTKDGKDNKISTLEMFGKKGTVLRALWAEMPEVMVPLRLFFDLLRHAKILHL